MAASPPPQLLVSGVRNDSHALLVCTVTNTPPGAGLSIPAALPLDCRHVAIGVNTYAQYAELARVNVDALTVYNGAARLAYRSPPASMPSIPSYHHHHRGGGDMLPMAFLANLDAIKSSEAHDCPAVVFADLAPDVFTASAAVAAHVTNTWAVGGNFDLRPWHLIVPRHLHVCFDDLCTSMPNIRVWENVQQALGFRSLPPPMTMTVSCSAPVRALCVTSDPAVSPRKRHDGSFEVTNLARHSATAFQLIVTTPRDNAPEVHVQLDGNVVTGGSAVVRWLTAPPPEWDAEFAFLLAARAPSPSPIVQSLLAQLSSGGVGYEDGGGGSLARSASTYGGRII